MDLNTTTKTAADLGLEHVSKPLGRAFDQITEAVERTQGTEALARMEAEPLWLWSEARIAADVVRLCPQRTLEQALKVAGIVRYWGGAWTAWRASNPSDPLQSWVDLYAVALRREAA